MRSARLSRLFTEKISGSIDIQMEVALNHLYRNDHSFLVQSVQLGFSNYCNVCAGMLSQVRGIRKAEFRCYNEAYIHLYTSLLPPAGFYLRFWGQTEPELSIFSMEVQASSSSR